MVDQRERRFGTPLVIAAALTVSVGAAAGVTAVASRATRPRPAVQGLAAPGGLGAHQAPDGTAGTATGRPPTPRAPAGTGRTATRTATPRPATATPPARTPTAKAPARQAGPRDTSRTTSSRTTSSRSSSRSVSVSSAPTRLSSVVRGKATHYGPASPGGNCSFPAPPANRLTVAVGPSLYRSAGGCGAILSVSGPGGRIQVKVDNLCPECGPGHLDLSDEAFARLAPLGRGLIPVSYRIVRNPAVSGGLRVRVKEGSSAFWLAVLVDNTGNRLSSVAVRQGSRWRSLDRADYNYWILGSGAGSGPFTLRVRDVEGRTATVRGVRLAPGQVQRTSARLS